MRVIKIRAYLVIAQPELRFCVAFRLVAKSPPSYLGSSPRPCARSLKSHISHSLGLNVDLDRTKSAQTHHKKSCIKSPSVDSPGQCFGCHLQTLLHEQFRKLPGTQAALSYSILQQVAGKLLPRIIRWCRQHFSSHQNLFSFAWLTQETIDFIRFFGNDALNSSILRVTNLSLNQISALYFVSHGLSCRLFFVLVIALRWLG